MDLTHWFLFHALIVAAAAHQLRGKRDTATARLLTIPPPPRQGPDPDPTPEPSRPQLRASERLFESIPLQSPGSANLVPRNAEQLAKGTTLSREEPFDMFFAFPVQDVLAKKLLVMEKQPSGFYDVLSVDTLLHDSQLIVDPADLARHAENPRFPH